MGLYDEVTAADLDQRGGFLPQPRRACDRGASPLAHESLRALLGERGYRIAEFNSVLIRRIQPGGAVLAAAGRHHRTRNRRRPSEPWMRPSPKASSRTSSSPRVSSEDSRCCREPWPSWRASKIKWSAAAAGGSFRKLASPRFSGRQRLPEYRGRGVQTALIAQRLHEAALAGCEYAVVSTNPGSGSQRNMERRGFHVAYTKPVMMRDVAGTTLRTKYGHRNAFGAVAWHFPTPLRMCSGDTTSASRSTASCSP